MDLDSFLTSLYVSVDDWWQAGRSSAPHRPGRPALLADPEVLALAILAQWPRFRSERDFRRFARAYLRGYFPTLCSQGQFNRRVQVLEPEVRALQRALAGELSGPSAVYRALDTTLVPAMVRAVPKGAVLRSGLLRAQRVRDRVAVRLQGGAGGGASAPLGKTTRTTPTTTATTQGVENVRYMLSTRCTWVEFTDLGTETADVICPLCGKVNNESSSPSIWEYGFSG